MKKIILSLLVMFLSAVNIQAKTIKADFEGVIKDIGADKSSISVSIINAKNGNVVYSLNEKALMNPASVQKIITMPMSAEALGKDYKFKTTLYSRGEDKYVIKLGGDPYLKSTDLKTLVNPVKIGAQQVYIDDSILDDKTWGEGWQWDDDMNPLMPRFGAYNLDKNIIKIKVVPSETGQYATIVNPSKYPFVFYNNVTSSNVTNLDVKRDNAVSANTLTLSGTISRQTLVQIPSNNIKRYFELKLTQALEDHKIYIKNPYQRGHVIPSDKELVTIEHDLKDALNDVLQNSNNMVAETIFKLAGGGSDLGGIEKFNSYCAKHNIDASGVKITDGSGVSKNNLVSADFVTSYLFASKDNFVMEYLPKPGEGTLTQRMLPLRENLKAKTGTLSGISAIAGYLKSKKGNDYIFCIIQNGVKLSDSDKKMLEDYMLREAYLKL